MENHFGLSPEEYENTKQAAAKFGISVGQFIEMAEAFFRSRFHDLVENEKDLVYFRRLIAADMPLEELVDYVMSSRQERDQLRRPVN
jgi:hypothetical protein